MFRKRSKNFAESELLIFDSPTLFHFCPPGERKLRILPFPLTELSNSYYLTCITEFLHLELLWLPLEGFEPFLSVDDAGL